MAKPETATAKVPQDTFGGVLSSFKNPVAVHGPKKVLSDFFNFLSADTVALSKPVEKFNPRATNVQPVENATMA